MVKCLVFLGVGGSFVGGFVFGVFGLSGVVDLGDVSAVAVDGVADGLDAAIGQQDVVRSGNDFTVAGLLVTEIVVGGVILDLVGEVVGHGVLQLNMKILFELDAESSLKRIGRADLHSRRSWGRPERGRGRRA